MDAGRNPAKSDGRAGHSRFGRDAGSVDLHRIAGAAWAEAGIDQGARRDSRHRPRGEAFGELTAEFGTYTGLRVKYLQEGQKVSRSGTFLHLPTSKRAVEGIYEV